MIQDKITKFRDILDKSLKSDKQRKYANDLLDTIIKELNYRENIIKNLSSRGENDYQTELEKAGDILLVMGFSMPEFNSLQKGIIQLLIKERKKFKRCLTVVDLRKFNNMYNCYKEQFNDEPGSLEDLKKIYENVSK